MKHIFTYKQTEYFDIKNMSVIGDFNNWDETVNIMKKNEEGIWWNEVELSSGEHLYKFIINDNIRMNDPIANLYALNKEGELMSLIIINENDERLYNNEQYTVHIEKYNMLNQILEEDLQINKKYFNINIDEKVVTKFEFTNVTGVHAITVLWYKPDNTLHSFSENILFTPDGEEDKPITMWFWIELNTEFLLMGMWSIKLFVDGEFILEDGFNIGNSPTYTSMKQKHNTQNNGFEEWC